MYLEKEINEQAAVLERLLQEQHENVAQIAAAIRDFNPAYIMIAARGTSDNAARYGQYVFGSSTRLPVALSTPSLHTLYEAPPNLSKGLVIGISQSGQAEDVRRVLADARSQGALTVSMTNDEESPMAQAADHHIYLSAGLERSVAATKTYTAELTSVAMLATALSQNSEMVEQLTQLPDLMKSTLDMTANIADWAERYRYMEQFAAIGRGYNYATAFEISLKVKELTYVIGEGYSEADFRHGPIATVNEGFPVIVVAPQGRALPQMLDLLDKLCNKKAELLVISNDSDALGYATKTMSIPEAPEWLSPMLGVVPGQVLAMHLALVRGYAVDRPRGLTKVTVTE
ncbi:SIS domain-containing protein [Phototrophicus methaneseepsis]|uniref:SIS domain-containing protein n=1 Tax=Phototrophicus methaneseepsis TaxID=2710758 RepID=A0A7S8EB75_9CHLR|nr:SIS domain-containing protein [Phototrophicus methaneseepsis]QPC83573.1 SIS domain-containing protein [Phototrophicus methaneseepsis]